MQLTLSLTDTVYERKTHFIYHSQDQFFYGNLTWQNLKGLVELANLTVPRRLCLLLALLVNNGGYS